MTDVSCPNPDEVVTHRTLQAELEKLRHDLRAEFNADLAQNFKTFEETQRLARHQEHRALEENLRRALNADLAQHLGAVEEAAREVRKAENLALEERLLAGMRAIVQPVETQVEHETRIVRLEAQPARRVRARTTKPRKRR